MTTKIVKSPHAAKLLSSLQWQGFSNDCGPFTTATVLNALRDLHIEAADLAQRMNRPTWRGPLLIVRRVPNWATFPWGIADVLREHGLPASWRPLSSPQHLRQGLEQGDVLMPIIGSWKPLWAHVMTLVEWDADKGWGFANTQRQHHDMDWMTDELFSRQWRAMGRMVVQVKNH
jgi:hypothetical protein